MAMTFTGTSGKTDLPRLGHAAVTGAGIAGLLAARVLAEHFETVTLVERDTLPNAAEPRKETTCISCWSVVG
jgi:2-polyprenyl-6-methoxyphenol hydroxylase-like FAD-dependent oxidoreductase